MVQARQLSIDLPFIGGNGMNSPRVFELARDSSDNLWVGSPWSAESTTPENKRFIAAYQKAYAAMPDQFAAQAYDAMYIAAQALKKVRLSGKLEADRKALRDALPTTDWNGATGPFKFRQVAAPTGKPAGYDAVQTAIVMMTKANRYVIQK
jgi:branched-chain amino acid transport system substrate-binding protein